MTAEATQLSKRLATSSVLIAVATGTIFWAPAWIFLLVIEAFVLLGLNEFLTLAEKKGLVINRALGLVFGGLFPLSYYFPAEPLLFVVSCVAIFLFNFHRRLRDQALVSTAVTVFGLVYVAWFFSYTMKIRYLADGARWVFYTILIVKLGDAAAYFIGKTFGRMKLVEHISPKKSIEGAVAGFVATVVASLASKIYLPQIEVFHLLMLGISLAVLSLLGDLAESLIKRDAGVKDSGGLPGLGGVLDVLDSLLLTVPFLYYYLTTFLGVS